MSPVWHLRARTSNAYSLPTLVIEPSTTAALAARSQISAATAGVSFVSAARIMKRSVWLMRASGSRARLDEFPNCAARVWRSAPSKAESPVAFANSAKTIVRLSVSLGLGEGSWCPNDQIGAPPKAIKPSPATEPKAASLCLRRNFRTR